MESRLKMAVKPSRAEKAIEAVKAKDARMLVEAGVKAGEREAGAGAGGPEKPGVDRKRSMVEEGVQSGGAAGVGGDVGEVAEAVRRGGVKTAAESHGGAGVTGERRGGASVTAEMRGGADAVAERRGGADVLVENRGGAGATVGRRGGADAVAGRRGGVVPAAEGRGEEEAAVNGSKRDSDRSEKEKASRIFDKKLTVVAEVLGQGRVKTMELMRAVKDICGGLLAFRELGGNKYELTVASVQGKKRLLDGFKLGAVSVMVRDLGLDEVVVSFLNLPAYISDEEILEKLDVWEVRAVSAIKRRVWPNTDIADGTRYLKVKFTETVQSLPYSAKFMTAAGPEYFRVLHNNQVRVCRLCLQPGHIVRDCPDFTCFKCNKQGHYARECDNFGGRCTDCHNQEDECVCEQMVVPESDAESERGGSGSEVDRGGSGSGLEGLERLEGLEDEDGVGEVPQSFLLENDSQLEHVAVPPLKGGIMLGGGGSGAVLEMGELPELRPGGRWPPGSSSARRRDPLVPPTQLDAEERQNRGGGGSLDSDLDMDFTEVTRVRKRGSGGVGGKRIGEVSKKIYKK